MSVDLSKLVSKQKITLQDLDQKIIAVDAYNMLYQFLSTIRQQDGTLLMNKSGKVTSHLSGIFYRTIDFVLHGIKPIFIFDGIPSVLKQRTIQARTKKRQDAYELWNAAKASGNIEQAGLYARISTKVNKEIVETSKQLLDLMGMGYIDAPSEAEAQASYMCRQGQVFATASQDYDTLLFGSPHIVRNMSISGKRKLPRKNFYINVETELLDLEKTKENLNVNQNQLIWIGLMLGTDFNEGINGIGPKTSLKIVKQCNSLQQIKEYVNQKYNKDFDYNIEEVEQLFLKPDVKQISDEDMKQLMSNKLDEQALIDFMCNENDFIPDRITKYINKLVENKQISHQKTIFHFQ